MRVIAIDGPAGSGKSTVARRLAERLGLEYLDTGAMYRSVAFAVLQRGLDPDDADAVARVARAVEIVVDRRCERRECDHEFAAGGPRAVTVAATPRCAGTASPPMEWSQPAKAGHEGRDMNGRLSRLLKGVLTAAPEVRAALRRRSSRLDYERWRPTSPAATRATRSRRQPLRVQRLPVIDTSDRRWLVVTICSGG